MNSQDIEMCKRKIMQHVPIDGSTIGNKMLMSLLVQEGISEEQYLSTRDELLKAGVLKTGRGRGGSVRLVRPIEPVPPPPPTDELKRKQELKKLLLKLIPENGGSVGNMHLLKQVRSGITQRKTTGRLGMHSLRKVKLQKDEGWVDRSRVP